jgi:hypothetical protein
VSVLRFDRSNEKLTMLRADGTALGPWDAANNVARDSNGIWPDGQYGFSFYAAHPGDPPISGPDTAYGSHGIFIFNVPHRIGMGVHSGRANLRDGFKKLGFEHCTMGCIRTTDATMVELLAAHAGDPIASITVTT